ncbi:MAG TPA: hypothetical protein VIZ17_21470 [Acetobacteraceae bacterium]
MSGAVAHPSPHRDRAGIMEQMFAVFGGPAAWVTQLIVNYAFASFTCYPRVSPRTSVVPGWGGIWDGLLALNLIAIVVALAAAWAGLRVWQATRGEGGGASGEVLELAEGRTRFLGIIGIMTGLYFLSAVVFDTIALFLVPQCIG